MREPMQLILGVTLLAAIAGAAVDASAAKICVSPTKPTCESTIQAGVDAAVAGDIITVGKGRYDENVVVPAGKDGLTIRGGGSSVLDAGLPNTGDALTIASAASPCAPGVGDTLPPGRPQLDDRSRSRRGSS